MSQKCPQSRFATAFRQTVLPRRGSIQQPRVTSGGISRSGEIPPEVTLGGHQTRSSQPTPTRVGQRFASRMQTTSIPVVGPRSVSVVDRTTPETRVASCQTTNAVRPCQTRKGGMVERCCDHVKPVPGFGVSSMAAHPGFVCSGVSRVRFGGVFSPLATISQ